MPVSRLDVARDSWGWPRHAHVVVGRYGAGVHHRGGEWPQQRDQFLRSAIADGGDDRRGQTIGVVLDALTELHAHGSDASILIPESALGQLLPRDGPVVVAPPPVRAQAVLGGSS